MEQYQCQVTYCMIILCITDLFPSPSKDRVSILDYLLPSLRLCQLRRPSTLQTLQMISICLCHPLLSPVIYWDIPPHFISFNNTSQKFQMMPPVICHWPALIHMSTLSFKRSLVNGEWSWVGHVPSYRIRVWLYKSEAGWDPGPFAAVLGCPFENQQ